MVDAHETNRQAGGYFSRKSGLEQPHHALLLLTRTHEQDVGGLCLYGEFVARDERDPPPGHKRGTEHRYGGRWYPSVIAFAAKSGDRAGMRQEEAWLLPDLGDEVVHVVGRGCAVPGLYFHFGRDVVEQTILGVVDEGRLLALLDLLYQKAQLLPDLVVRTAVQIGDARLHVQNAGHRGQRVFARLFLVIHIDLGQVELHVGVAFDGAA